MARFLALAVGSVLLLLALLSLAAALAWPRLLGRFVYLPDALPAAESAPARYGFAQGEEVWFSSRGGVRLHGWWLPADVPRPCGAVLLLHGNAANVARQWASAPWLNRLGLDVLLFDYRGYGRSTGRPSEQGLYADAEAAYRYLTREQAVPAERVLLFGHSLGSAVATELAGERETAGIVLAAPFTSLPAALQAKLPWLPVRGIPWPEHRFDALEDAPELDVPVLVAHATADALVPRAEAERLFRALPGPRRWVEVRGAGHNDMLVAPELRRAVSMLARERLGCEAPAG